LLFRRRDFPLLRERCIIQVTDAQQPQQHCQPAPPSKVDRIDEAVLRHRKQSEAFPTPVRKPRIVRSGLVLAYRATDYLAFSDCRAFLIRIGHHSLVVDALLARKQTRSGTFITSWNPFGKSQSAEANACWDRELKRYLSARGFAFLPGEGRGEIGEWPPESSILVFGLSRARAASVGRRFRQNAIVYVPSGRPAELVMLRWLG
jgi:hypothetical protein